MTIVKLFVITLIVICITSAKPNKKRQDIFNNMFKTVDREEVAERRSRNVQYLLYYMGDLFKDSRNSLIKNVLKILKYLDGSDLEPQTRSTSNLEITNPTTPAIPTTTSISTLTMSPTISNNNKTNMAYDSTDGNEYQSNHESQNDDFENTEEEEEYVE